MKLLEDTIKELKGEDLEDEWRATVNLKIDLRVDQDYIPDMNQRLSAYRRMASARSMEEIDRLLEELRDRYGPAPASIINLAQHARVRVVAERIGLESVEKDVAAVVLKFRPDAKLDPAMLLKLVQGRPDLTLLPPAVLRLSLDGVQAGRGRSTSDPVRRSEGSASWWTARAATGVAPGFSREHILAEAPQDPSAPGGLFERVGELLDQLSQTMITG
jgi:transcription-repair coupling factor (superfamily II helicase)